MHDRRRLLLLLVALLLMAAACGDSDGAEEQTGAGTGGTPAGETTTEGEESPSTSAGSRGTTGSEAADRGGEGPAYLDAAMEEGEVTWYSTIPAEPTAAIAERFEAAYPGISVQVHRDATLRLFQRFIQEEEAGQTLADVLTLSELSLAADLASQGLLAPHEPANLAAMQSDYAQYNDPDHHYTISTSGSVILCYNTDQLTEEEAPHSWLDLLDPRWEGQIASGHPGASGSVATWATQMLLENGREYLEQLAAQDVLIGQSLTEVGPRVASGERMVGICLDQSIAQEIAAGDPMAIVYPTDGAVILPTASMVTAGASNPNAAKLLVDFLLTEEVQAFLRDEQSSLPVIEGVEPPEHVPADATYVRPSLEQMGENIEAVVTLWRELFGV